MRRQFLSAVSLVWIVAALAACGGSGGSSTSSGAAKVGDCIDASKQVVDCSSSDATDKLVSDQNAPNAIACVVIDTPPQREVSVGSGMFCAQPLK
jgi:hypothetical protein